MRWFGFAALPRAVPGEVGLGLERPAVVFSDGAYGELAPLLELPRAGRSPFPAAITDLLALTQAAAVIASRSTFSLWGVYLGQAPSIRHPPNRDILSRRIVRGEDGRGLELEWTTGAPIPAGFATALERRLDGTSGLSPAETIGA